jgi:hypothetical protein
MLDLFGRGTSSLKGREGGTFVFFLWQLEQANLFSGPRMMGRGGRYTRVCFRRVRAREEARILEKSGSPSPSRSGSSVVLLPGEEEERLRSLLPSMMVSGYAQGGVGIVVQDGGGGNLNGSGAEAAPSVIFEFAGRPQEASWSRGTVPGKPLKAHRLDVSSGPCFVQADADDTGASSRILLAVRVDS